MNKQLIDSYHIKFNVCQNNINNIISLIEKDESTKIALEEELKQLELVHELLTKLKQFKMDSKKDFILKTINTALKDIFQKEIRIDIEATSNLDNGKINMKYDIILFQNDIEIARNEKLTESNGGGILSVISILFKMLVGFIYSDNKFYMFDESLSQVSEEFRPRLSKFLREFSEKQNFTIILVSHTKDLDTYAHTVYSLSGSYDKYQVPVLHIDEVIGEYPSENYIYAKIKNFQSIVDLEFRFKGFTVIRGENNIGKSATLRAINAVIFNDFSKDTQRITKERSIETSIEFGHSSDENKKIRVSYKSQKVNYEFNNMVFAGKNLAFDKVQEKIESIGFKYINLKEAYKNFKGNLKDQAERISLTTQHDGLFLIGSKNTDSSKIFDFLFDSYQVALAIAKVKNDINDKLNLFNVCGQRIAQNNMVLKGEKLKERYYSTQYYLNLISYNFTINTQINYLNNKINIGDKIQNLLNYNIYIFKSIIYLNDLSIKIQKIQNNNINIKINKINSIIAYLKNMDIINSFITKQNSFDKILNSITLNNKKIKIYEKLYSYSFYQNIFKSIKEKNNSLKSLLIKEEFNLKKINILQNLIKTGNLNLIHNRWSQIFNRFIEINNSYGVIDIKIEKNLNKINILKNQKFKEENIKYLNSINTYMFNLNNSIDATTEKINYTQNELNGLANKYNLEKCKTCGGVGYSHLH